MTVAPLSKAELLRSRQGNKTRRRRRRRRRRMYGRSKKKKNFFLGSTLSQTIDTYVSRVLVKWSTGILRGYRMYVCGSYSSQYGYRHTSMLPHMSMGPCSSQHGYRHSLRYRRRYATLLTPHSIPPFRWLVPSHKKESPLPLLKPDSVGPNGREGRKNLT